MPVRYPPDDKQYPRTTNRDLRQARVVSYVEARRSFPRRVLRRLFSAPVIIPVVFVSAIVLGVLIYYWTIFSGRIDNLLAGEVYTRTAGIYAAPKQLRVNESISQADVITFLKRAGGSCRPSTRSVRDSTVSIICCSSFLTWSLNARR